MPQRNGPLCYPLIRDGAEEAPAREGLAQGHREGQLPSKLFVTIRKWVIRLGLLRQEH